jgi:hypothetical protein
LNNGWWGKQNAEKGLKMIKTVYEPRSNQPIRQMDQIDQMSLFGQVVASVKRAKSVNDTFFSVPHVTHLTFLS